MLERVQHGRQRCPDCRSATINVQGVAVCPDYTWTADD